MWKFICAFLLCAGLSVDVSAQDDKENARRILESLNSLDDSKATREYNAWRSKYKHFRSRPSVGYQPIITWIPEGVGMGIGPVTVSPDRRYIRFGVNFGFYSIKGVDTFTFRR